MPRPFARRASIDNKAPIALSLGMASKIVTALNCGIADLLEMVEGSKKNVLLALQSDWNLGHFDLFLSGNRKVCASAGLAFFAWHC